MVGGGGLIDRLSSQEMGEGPCSCSDAPRGQTPGPQAFALTCLSKRLAARWRPANRAGSWFIRPSPEAGLPRQPVRADVHGHGFLQRKRRAANPARSPSPAARNEEAKAVFVLRED